MRGDGSSDVSRKYLPSETAFPERFHQTLKSRHYIIKEIRAFFDRSGYVEVETPTSVKCPGIDPYIDALPSYDGLYQTTSPELQMKRLLGLGVERIYQINHAFRADEMGRLHSPEFTMLEWYRTGTDYRGVMEEAENLLKSIIESAGCVTTSWEFPFDRMKVDDLFKEKALWKPSQDWDEDRYFRDWVQTIEPFLSSLKGVFVMDFPARLSSLSKIKKENPSVCERFELFMGGVEIGNAYTELTDYREHVSRFKRALEKRSHMKKSPYPLDEGFMESLKQGLPECGGMAVGIDRLVMVLLGLDSIDKVQTFPMGRL